MLGPLSCRWKHADGSWRTLEMTGAHLPHEPDIAGLVVNVRDISERERDLARLHASRAELEESHALLKASSAQVEASLREKEVLLKEIHHRVKNNMQVISSILSLQSAMLDDPSLRLALREMQGRIKSMALIHEKLYRSDDLARVDFADYLRVLCHDLMRSHPPHGSRRPAKLDLDLDLLSLNIEQAAPCGLLVNELVSNSLKHAFKDFDRDETPLVRVRLTHVDASENASESSGDEVVIEVSDNGRGMEPGVDWRTGDSLGLQLVETLAEQLEGEIECCVPSPEHSQVLEGTLWRLRFRSHVESEEAVREQIQVLVEA
jgi:two-component sensor histidine kinase